MSGFRSAMSPERSGNVTGARRSPGTVDPTGRTFRAQIHGDEPAEEATHMKVDGSEGFQAHVEVMCAPLGELVGAFQALRERRSFLPDANSEAMRELSEQSKYAGAWGDEPSALAHNLAHLQLAAAEDCIEAVIALVRGPRAAVFSPIVLARAALECCGRARWLAEPGIGTKYRVARGMSEHLYSLFELGRLPGKDEQAKAAQRRLLETAKELRFETRSAKGQKVVALEGPRPSQREAIRTVLSDDSAEGLGEVLWRYSSATAHGTAWALVQSLDPVASEE